MEIQNISVGDGDIIYVSIPLKEYKELLITKGRYEELKSQVNSIPWTTNPRTKITYTYNGREYQWPPEEREVTCKK